MKIKHFFSIVALLLAGGLALPAQTDYSITWDSTQNSFLMQQGKNQTKFDTGQVVINLAKGRETLGVIETEIQLLERLVLLRRQAAQVREENRTLEDILGKARAVAIKPKQGTKTP